MRRAGLAVGLVVASLGLGGCIRVDGVDITKAPGEVSLAKVFGDDADLVCVHDPAPPWLLDVEPAVDLKGSLRRSNLAAELKPYCSRLGGLWWRGRWVAPYETLVLRIRDCKVIGVRRVTVEGSYPIDGAPDEFCTKPDRLAAIRPAWSPTQTVLIDTQRRPDAVGRTPR